MLSVSMIVRNEESCLAKCLESVQGADEIVVVDTGSTDQTKRIAEDFGANLFCFPWVDDFSAARNCSLDHCTGDWILIIDADEVLEEGGIEKIRKAIDGAGDSLILLFDTVAEKNGDRHLSQRAFMKCRDIYWKGAAHNYLSISGGREANVQITYGYSDAHRKDPDRTLRILTKVLDENPGAVREAYYLAREYWYRRDYKQAAKWYADYLSRATWAPEIADAFLMVARCLWNTGQGDLARDACLQAIKINADIKEALLLMAEMSGPKNRQRWLRYAASATNEDVLFVRR